MINQRITTLSLTLVALAGLLLSACGKTEQVTSSSVNSTNNVSAKATGNDKSGSKDVSGKISFYTSQPEDDETKLVTAFNKIYPNVKVDVFRSGTEEVVAKIQAEKQAGGIQADVVLLADSVTFSRLKKDNLLLSYKSAQLDKIPKSFVDADNTYQGTKVMATVIAVNTQKVKTLPTSWKVLTSTEAKDNSIMPSPLYSGAAAYNIGVLTRTKDFGWDYITGLKANGMTVVQGNGAVLKAVAGGQKNYGMIVDFMAAREKAKGSPIELVYPAEGVPVITEPVGIIKGTKNEAAAKAFIDFVLSDDGQKVAVDLGYTPIRDGAQPPQGLKKIADLKIVDSDINTLTEARDEDKNHFTQIFGK